MSILDKTTRQINFKSILSFMHFYVISKPKCKNNYNNSLLASFKNFEQPYAKLRIKPSNGIIIIFILEVFKF